MAHDYFDLYAAKFDKGLNVRIAIERAGRFDYGV